MRYRSRVGIGYGEYWRGIIFDREYKNLDDIVAKTRRWFPKFNDGCKFKASKGEYSWQWPSGEELLLRAASDESDYDDYHGHEYPFIGWNELTKYPDPKLFDAMLSTNRSSFVSNDPNVPPIPLEVFCTTNPFGPGHNWVKRRFIDVAPYGTIVRRKTKIKLGDREEEVETTQVALFGSWRENPRLDLQYIANIVNNPNPAKRAAWADGSWDVVSGGAFDDVWSRSVHILPPFKIPAGWRIDRAFDWGSTHPFYVGWFAEADGTEAKVEYKGSEYTFCPPRGTVVLFAEWYGCEEIGTNVGLKLSSSEIAKGILAREDAMLAQGLISTKPYAGPADNQIFDVREADVSSIASKMEADGVSWIRSDKRPGSRKNGLQLVRDRFSAAIKREGKALFICESCEGAISTVPVLPRSELDQDDVDTSAEDHPYDVIRYRILHADMNSVGSGFKVSFT
jgi:hypothetical protein